MVLWLQQTAFSLSPGSGSAVGSVSECISKGREFVPTQITSVETDYEIILRTVILADSRRAFVSYSLSTGYPLRRLKHVQELTIAQFYMSLLMTKPTKWYLRPANTQISLEIRPFWSVSSLCAQWVVKEPSFLHADCEVFAGRTSHFVGFVMRRLICLLCLVTLKIMKQTQTTTVET